MGAMHLLKMATGETEWVIGKGKREPKKKKKEKEKKRGRQSVAGEGDEVKGEGAVEGGRGGAYKRQKTRTDRILPRL